MPPALRGTFNAAPGVASATSVVTPTNLAPTLPTHQADDLLLCYTACRLAAPTVATPAGWTQLLNVAGTNQRVALFGKVAASSSETTPTVTWSGLTTGTSGSTVAAQCAAFTGMQNNITGITDVLGAVENGAASATAVASGTAITTLIADDLVLSLTTRPDDVGVWTAGIPAGFTEIGRIATTSGADMVIEWTYLVKTTPGSVAPADYTITSGSSFTSTGILIALKAVPAPTPINSNDVNGATTESQSITAGIQASDVGVAELESVTTSAVLASSDVNGVTTEGQALTTAIQAADVNGTTVESQSVIQRVNVASSDVNGATTETATITFAATSTDNGTSVDSQQLVARPTSADVNGPTIETANTAVPIVSGDSGVGTETTTLVARPTSQDAGLGTEVQLLAAKPITSDSNSAVVENQSVQERNAVNSSDSGAGTETQQLVAKLTSADQNGATTEFGTTSSVTQKNSSDSGTATETASVVARVAGSDAGISTQAQTIKAIHTFDDYGAGVDAEQLIARILDDDNVTLTVVEDAVAGGDEQKFDSDFSGLITETATVQELVQVYEPIKGNLVIQGVNGNTKITETGGRTVVTSGVSGRTKMNGARSSFRRVR